MTKTILIWILVTGILAIGITAAYAGPNPLITLAGDVTVDGVLSNAAISTDLDTITTELQTMNTKLDTVTGIQGPQGPQGEQGPPGAGLDDPCLFLSQLNQNFQAIGSETGIIIPNSFSSSDC